ncbi:MAG: hypothetical protein LWY06_02935 [Firmicutes bacterium]|nr:hypothetical protein [Bacillota bacterium]
MAKKFFIASVLLLLFAAPIIALADEGSELKQGAQSPQVVYARYVDAVHKGDINTAKELVYSRSRELWNKDPKKMLAMTKNGIPTNPVLQSMNETREFQYVYTVMKMTGTSARDSRPMVGEVRMIVEDGGWKVYTEVWRNR